MSIEKTYVDWAKRYTLFYDNKHPNQMGVKEIESFLTNLAVVCNVSASTQNQALSSLISEVSQLFSP